MLALQRAIAAATNRQAGPTNIPRVRLATARLERCFPLARGVAIANSQVGGVGVRMFSSVQGARHCVLHFHGGAYFCGTSNMGRRYSRLAAHGGPDIISVDYRLAPEHPYPAGLEDALAVYSALPYERVVVMGDSAGGGLGLALAQRLRDEGGRTPAGLLLFFPWIDLTQTAASWQANAGRDMLTRAGLSEAAHRYAGELGLDHLGVSPLFGSLQDLPPTHIAVGSRDSLHDDATRAAKAMADAGVDVTLRVTPDAFHGFVTLPVPEARNALTEARTFIDRCVV